MGYTTYTCTRCGDTYTDHTHSYTTTVVEPTCTEDGYTLHACACGYSYQDNVVSKLGHRYIVIAEDGENATYRCTRCGRPRAYYRKFGLCRVCFRELALKGELPGVKKASW